MSAAEARPTSARRLGLLGGTFDPPHVAHLAVAEEAREVLGLERVVFVPAGEPWQKADRAVSPGHLRLAMVERAIAGNPRFVLDGREVRRSGPSYTVETIAALAAELDAAVTGVTSELWFILSEEALRGFHTWHEPDRILALTRLCVVPRGGGGDVGAAVSAFRERFPVADDRIVVLDRPRLAISSTEIRARVRAGRSIRYLVPDGVVALIAEYALYADDPAPVRVPADA